MNNVFTLLLLLIRTINPTSGMKVKAGALQKMAIPKKIPESINIIILVLARLLLLLKSFAMWFVSLA